MVGLLVVVHAIDADVEATSPVGGLVRVTVGASGCTVQLALAGTVPAMFEAVTVTVCEPTERPETL